MAIGFFAREDVHRGQVRQRGRGARSKRMARGGDSSYDESTS